MANIKISELNELTNIATDDLLPIVDTSVNETKKVQLKNVLNVELIAISDTAPAECLAGDKYYNTEDNKIYTAIATDTWGTIGETPVKGVFYIVFNEQSSYSYDGSTLISVGGGTEDIVISDTEPTEEDWKIWIDSDKQTDNTYYNDNGTPTNIKTTTYDTLPVGAEVDYDGETVPTGWTETTPIIESGSNANGNWIKYNDGTMICYQSQQFNNYSITGTQGVLYTATLTPNDYPVAFVGNLPIVSRSIKNTTWTVYGFGSNSSTAPSLTNSGSFEVFRGSSTGTGTVNTTIDIIAIGRWK